MSTSAKPALRPLDFQPVTYQNQPMWLLRDPLSLTSQQLMLPGPLAQMLLFCDGTRTPREIHQAFCDHVGEFVDFDVVVDALEQLDAALLLDNARSRQAQQRLLQAFRTQPHRPPALAGHGYPVDTAQLDALFAGFSKGDALAAQPSWRGRGVIAPHIDYQRGGPLYAKVWQRAETAVLDAELVIILGTDHKGGFGTVTLTRLPYATPYGVLPTDLVLVDELAAAIGPDAAFADELNHRDEHSIELSAVWLHYLTRRAGLAPKPMLPLLVGSFQHFLQNGNHPLDDDRLTAVVAALRRIMADRKVLFVASVDLAHVGPAFGDTFLMDGQRRATLRAQDEALMEAAVRGDAAAWYTQIARVQDRNRICGFSPVYLLLRVLGASKGHLVAYEQCPADVQDTSLVSICGLLLE